ncbi:CBO0543 family protein [Bacillus sp. USDA818B3_A]|uniref:CBO0543 family protein n=1 Tax=Bacillus sp. USDA818B3_A TaxID=2698834 RepID=UPI003FA412E6
MLHTIISYLRLFLPVLYIFAAWKVGDWRHWKKYYPTMLFIISVDFFISIIMYRFPLWTFNKSFFNPNHTIFDFIVAFTVFIPLVLIFLSRYPYKSMWYKQMLYISAWVIFEVVLESIFFSAKLITYHNGWNFWWSCVVWFFLFIGVRLHHTKPLWAWFLCFTCTVFLIIYFHIPITKFR